MFNNPKTLLRSFKIIGNKKNYITLILVTHTHASEFELTELEHSGYKSNGALRLARNANVQKAVTAVLFKVQYTTHRWSVPTWEGLI